MDLVTNEMDHVYGFTVSNPKDQTQLDVQVIIQLRIGTSPSE